MSVKAINRDQILIYHPPELPFRGGEVDAFIFLCSRLNPLSIVPHVLGCLLSLLFFPLPSLWYTAGAPNLTWFYPNPLVKAQRIAQASWTLMLNPESIVQTSDIITSQKSLGVTDAHSHCLQFEGFPPIWFLWNQHLRCHLHLCWHRRGKGFHSVSEIPMEDSPPIFRISQLEQTLETI